MERLKFFDKTNKKMNLRQKFDYIKKHYYYYTMNTWNGAKSLANNVKVYNLPLTKEQKDRFFELYCDENLNEGLYCDINYLIENFNRVEDFDVFFNGRSGGYLVAYQKDSNKNIIDEDLFEAENYDELIKIFKEWRGWSFRDSQTEAKRMIEENFEIVKKFDVFCDSVLFELIDILNNAEIKEEEFVITKKRKVLIV